MNEVIQQAERDLVALALLDPRVAVDSGLKPLQFYDPRWRLVWEQLLKKPEPSEAIFRVADGLSEDGTLDAVGGLSCLSKLVSEPVLSEKAPHLTDLVRQGYLDRTLAIQLSEALQKLQGGGHAHDLIGPLSDRLDVLRRSGATSLLPTAADLVEREKEQVLLDIEHPDGMLKPLTLPWGLEQAVPAGCPPDKLTVLFGPTGGFKSTIGNGIARHFAQSFAPSEPGVVVKFGLEDSALLEAQKLVSQLTGVGLHNIVTRKLNKPDIAKLRTCGADWLRRLVIIDDVVPTPDEMIRTYRAIDNVKAVFYDYIQLIDWEGSDERVAVHKFCLRMQRAAKADKVAHIALSQLREDLMEAADPEGKRPRMQWLFGSSAIKNMSKLIMGVYRPWNYFPDPSTLPRGDSIRYGAWAKSNPEDWKRLVEIVVRKQQVGDINITLPVLVDLPTGRVERATI